MNLNLNNYKYIFTIFFLIHTHNEQIIEIFNRFRHV